MSAEQDCTSELEEARKIIAHNRDVFLGTSHLEINPETKERKLVQDTMGMQDFYDREFTPEVIEKFYHDYESRTEAGGFIVGLSREQIHAVLECRVIALSQSTVVGTFRMATERQLVSAASQMPCQPGEISWYPRGGEHLMSLRPRM